MTAPMTREELLALASKVEGPPGALVTERERMVIADALRAVAQTAPTADPEIAAVHSALLAANIPYSAFSCNGFNLVGDSKSIKEVARAFHSHAQINEFRTQIRHWREECGKLSVDAMQWRRLREQAEDL